MKAPTFGKAFVEIATDSSWSSNAIVESSQTRHRNTLEIW